MPISQVPNPSSPAPRKKWAVVFSSSLAVNDHIPAGAPTHPASAGISLILPAGNNVNSRQQIEEAVLQGRLLLTPEGRGMLQLQSSAFKLHPCYYLQSAQETFIEDTSTLSIVSGQ